MLLRSLVRPALVLLVVSLGGCRIVDPAQVQFFGCAEGGRCPSGLLCCGDSTCRASCTGAGGGAATGGGGGSSTGGGTGGGSVGGGDGGGGGEIDAGIACGPATCPNGCCDGNTCVPGQSAAKCGRAGGACEACPGSEACIDGACGGCLQTCTTGCCSGATCATRGIDTCGANATACSSCGMGSDTCTGSGQCQCGNGSSCAAGQRCAGGQCVCDATSCAGGCCTASGACLRPNQQSGAQCGLNGVSCGGCDAPPAAACTSAADRTAYRAPGTCGGGVCVYATQTFTCAFGCTDGSCVNDVCQGCLVPPQAVCVGAVRRSYQSPGTCGANGCTYSQVDTSCAFGCNAGTCNPDPCAGVFCGQPPAARCNGNISISYAPQGACSQGACTYAETQTTCQYSCSGATGQCTGDPCSGVSCTTPPVSTCVGSVRHSFISPGACSQGGCTYAAQDVTCSGGCNAGQCLGDPCGGVSCTAPSAICLNGSTRRTYASTTCNLGSCDYPTTDSNCPYGCVGGSCLADPCAGTSCNTPPGPTCQGSLRRTFSSTGTCASGTCSYTATDTACNTPPAAICVGTSRRTYALSGTCSSGLCSYTTTDSACANGCTGGVCNPDLCAGVTCTAAPPPTCLDLNTVRTSGNPGTCGAGVCGYPTQDITCNTPPPSSCVAANTVRTFNPTGSCSAGMCSYTSTDSPCANGCSGTGCNGDPCATITCNSPPAPTCASPDTRKTYAASGICSAGTCNYGSTNTLCNTPPPNFCATSTTLRSYGAGACSNGACGYGTTDSTCNFGCANGQCNPDPCAGVNCTTAPTADCANPTTRRTYNAPGTCSGGSCNFTSTSTACNSPPAPTCNGPDTVRTYSASGTCSGGACSYAPVDALCNAPPIPICVGGNARSYASPGACTAGQGSCTYAPVDQTCQFGCSGGVCSGDPCFGVTCNSPPPSVCQDASTLLIYASAGICAPLTGQCSYGTTPSSCPNGCLSGACQNCGPQNCAEGCCLNNSCQLDVEVCRGTGGGTCGPRCFGQCDSCGNYFSCDLGTCVCNGGLLAKTGSTTEAAPPICF